MTARESLAVAARLAGDTAERLRLAAWRASCRGSRSPHLRDAAYVTSQCVSIRHAASVLTREADRARARCAAMLEARDMLLGEPETVRRAG